MKSFVDAGHPTKLYTYAQVDNVPDGVEIVDANDILPTREFILNAATGKAGPHSDMFRYHLLAKTDEIWVDTDAYCCKPFPVSDYLFGNHYKQLIANGVLRLPKSSATLQSLIEFTADEYPDIPDDFSYVTRRIRNMLSERREQGDPMHISELPWEMWGPYAISYFAEQHGEARHSTGKNALYPLAGGEIVRTLQMPRRAKIRIPEETLSIHFYGSKIRGLLARRGGIPSAKSLLGQLCAKHGVDPSASPIEPVAC